jgi:hypothetical protein
MNVVLAKELVGSAIWPALVGRNGADDLWRREIWSTECRLPGAVLPISDQARRHALDATSYPQGLSACRQWRIPPRHVCAASSFQPLQWIEWAK